MEKKSITSTISNLIIDFLTYSFLLLKKIVKKQLNIEMISIITKDGVVLKLHVRKLVRHLFISACIRFNNISKLKIHQLGKFVKSFNTTNQLYQRKMVILIHSSMSNKKTYQMISKNHLISDQKESQMRKRRKNKWNGKTRSINVQNVIKSSRIFPNTNTMKNVSQNSNKKQ